MRVPALDGVRVLEFASVGPVPYCALMLAQMGAHVVRVESPRRRDLGVPTTEAADLGTWQRERVALDLKQPDQRERALALAADSDLLIEGYRPGVMERLGLGPADCHARHPGLIYGRLSGWGRRGPWAARAGHDINYLAMSGALHAIGPHEGPPCPPLNLVGDFAGGSCYLAVQLLAALHARATHGRGVVIDAAIVDGTLHLLSGVYARLGAGLWRDARASNVIDGGAPWYRCYRCADGGWMAVGAIEARFYETFVRGLGIDPATLPAREARAHWPLLAQHFADAFAAHPRAHWEAVYEALDACVTPVLALQEARGHALHAPRARFHERDGMAIPVFGARDQG